MTRAPANEAAVAERLLRLLVLEDRPADAELCLRELRRGGFEVSAEIAGTREEFVAHLQAGEYDLVLADYRLPGWNGMAALEELRRLGKDIPFILVTGSLGDELAVDCIQQGAADYVLKDRLARLPVAVRRALETRRLQEERARAEAERTRLMAAIEQAAEAVVITDPEGRIEYVNPAFSWITGYSREEALGQTPRLLKSGQHPPEFYRLLWETITSGKVWQGEMVNRRKDGTLYPEEMTITPVLAAGGKISNYIAIKQDVTERKRAETQLRELSGRLLQVQDEERRRLARELHDTVAQALAAMVLNLSRFQEPETPLDPQVERALTSALGIAEQAAREVRTLTYLLHPPLLEELGLVSALRSYAEGFTQRSGIRVELEAPPVQERFPAEVELALFRVAQESLANVHRHSGARQARIRLRTENGELCLEIADAGRGVAPSVLEKFERGGAELGVGLAGMRERLRQLGGRLEVRPENPGTSVRATLPLPAPCLR
jgi:PAS domain S-box-containing protein